MLNKTKVTKKITIIDGGLIVHLICFQHTKKNAEEKMAIADHLSLALFEGKKTIIRIE